jgi:hypothetical protein
VSRSFLKWLPVLAVLAVVGVGCRKRGLQRELPKPCPSSCAADSECDCEPDRGNGQFAFSPKAKGQLQVRCVWEKCRLVGPECSKSCTVDSDCDCGVDRGTGSCAFGRRECIDPSRQCPDYCTGMGGNRRLACIAGECQRVVR